MKTILILGCFAIPFYAVADIVPPPANYSIAADDTVIDATGQVNDDPEQVISLTPTEIPVVQNNDRQVDTKVELDWKLRDDSAGSTSP